MADQLEHTDSTLHHASSPGWQLLGELELTVNPDAGQTVGKWLAVILSPLDLRADFANKVLKSAQEAMWRAMQLAEMNRFEHLHLLIFVPASLASKGQSSWGFFRIEKVEAAEDQNNPDHTIEFYLYLEGQ